MELMIGRNTPYVNGYITYSDTTSVRSSYRSMSHLAEVLARVEKRLAAVGLSASAASKLSGKPDAIRNMQRAVEEDSGRQGVSTATLNALAPVLKTTGIWLFAAAGAEEIGAPEPTNDQVEVPPASETDSAILVPARRFVRAIYGGTVEAGSFREVGEFDDDPDRPVYMEEADPEFPEVPLVTFTVAGDSMNDLKPWPLLPGQRVVGLDFEGLLNRVPLRDGMVVVVEQTKGGGHLRERSVKQLALYRDRTEFCPRSTNPRHKPIVVPYEMMESDAEDGREVRILALVRRVTSDMPGW